MVQVIPSNYFPGVSRSPRSPKGRTGETGKITLPEVSRNGQNGQNGKTFHDQTNMAELLELAELGRKFRAQQHKGRRPGFLRQHITEIVKRRSPMTFERLLQELELQAAQRESDGASPIEKVDRIWGLLTIHIPGKGRTQISFGTLRNTLTKSRRDVIHGYG